MKFKNNFNNFTCFYEKKKTQIVEQSLKRWKNQILKSLWNIEKTSITIGSMFEK